MGVCLYVLHYVNINAKLNKYVFKLDLKIVKLTLSYIYIG